MPTSRDLTRRSEELAEFPFKTGISSILVGAVIFRSTFSYCFEIKLNLAVPPGSLSAKIVILHQHQSLIEKINKSICPCGTCTIFHIDIVNIKNHIELEPCPGWYPFKISWICLGGQPVDGDLGLDLGAVHVSVFRVSQLVHID